MEQEKNLSIQRRDYPRYELTQRLPIKLKTATKLIDATGETINISQSGIYTNMDRELPLSERVIVSFNLNDKAIDIKGRVLWVNKKDESSFLHGIDFSEYKEEIPEYWDGYISGVHKFRADRRIERERRNLDKTIKVNESRKTSDRRTDKPILKKCFTNKTVDFLEKQNNWFRLYNTSGTSHVIMEGKNVTSFSYCNYLGLSQNEEVKKAMVDSVLKDGAGISSSPLGTGTMYMHKELEQKLANFVGSEDSLLYPLGSLANAGVIPAIVDVNDIIVIDENSHASIIDGCLLSKAKIITYKHNDMEDLQKKLKNNEGNKIIITDGVFSMDGDIAKLDEIYELGKKYESAIFVDDAHGIGILGEHGAGIIEHFGLQGKIDFFMGTFAKAFGIQGGFVAGKKEIIKYLRYTSRTFVFNVSLQPYMVQGILTALEIVKNGKNLRDKLWTNVDFLKTKIRELGFDILNSETPIVPIMIRDNEKTKKLCEYLRENNVIVDAVFYPVVKKVNSMLRITVTSEHNIEDLENLLYFLNQGKKILNIK